MPKTIKNIFDDKLTFEKFLEAHYRAVKGKRKKKEIIKYEIDLETNLTNLIENIKNNKYKHGKYREFLVKEPKERIIRALPYKDRIVHQWYVEEFIKPYYLKRFIVDSYACIENKGVHKAVKKLQYYMRNFKRKNNKYYVLKCDIKKYFYSIDREILYKILQKRINDKKLLNFTKILLTDTSELGIPIGNYTSQFFANIYLNELDHFVKENLRVKYYIRYMDDFILLLNNKEDAKDKKQKIESFLKQNLNLELNQKSSYYPNSKGINFCGYVIYETHLKLRKRCKNKIKRNIKIWNKKYINQNIDITKVKMSWNSFKAHSKHASSYNFINKMNNTCLFKEKL